MDLRIEFRTNNCSSVTLSLPALQRQQHPSARLVFPFYSTIKQIAQIIEMLNAPKREFQKTDDIIATDFLEVALVESRKREKRDDEN